jgi:type III pantothenate kinase
MTTYSIADVRLSSVAGEDAALKAVLATLTIPVLWLTPAVPCPIKPVEGVPSTYGADRWAADIGAIAQDPDHTLLVIDAGTCITYDLFSSDGVLLGGAISPGVQLRLNAMHEHTALLPQIEAEQEAHLLGYDTRTHMLSAAVNGARFEIEGYIRVLLCEYLDLHVFMTGGNAFEFSEDITCPITHDPYLVFKGLVSL